MSQHSFSSLLLAKPLIQNLKSLGYLTMTPVQEKTLPLILQGKDVIVQAKTGSGKTATFGLGMLHKINAKQFKLQALVLCPTRELADQVAKEIRQLARCIPNIKLLTLCGGKPLAPQAESLASGTHIVVGTPGRLQDHLSRQTLDLSQIEMLVLDEADRMLDMGFQDEILAIIQQMPEDRQTLMFSATYPTSIKKMVNRIQQNPISIKVDVEHKADVIEQYVYQTNNYQRKATLLALLDHHRLKSTVVFCHTKIQCHEVGDFLQQHGVDAVVLHGDLEQRDRDQILIRFSHHSSPVLVATDVAARGLDIKSLQAVINYELPHDPDIYLHRIGRTGRAGEKGTAYSLYTESEIPRLIAIEELLGISCQQESADSLTRRQDFSLTSDWVTFQIDSGKKNKMRPGDLLGALTKDAGLKGASIGKITIFDHWSYLAIHCDDVPKAINFFRRGKVKGRKVKVRELK